jgi:transcriptional regulator with XRE-family HTH domain
MPPALPPAPDLLRAWRERQGLSQGKAAALLGVHQNTWSDWEGRRKSPRIAMALAIAALTKGEVPTMAWLTRVELAFVRQLEKDAA